MRHYWILKYTKRPNGLTSWCGLSKHRWTIEPVLSDVCNAPSPPVSPLQEGDELEGALCEGVVVLDLDDVSGCLSVWKHRKKGEEGISLEVFLWKCLFQTVQYLRLTCLHVRQ